MNRIVKYAHRLCLLGSVALLMAACDITPEDADQPISGTVDVNVFNSTYGATMITPHLLYTDSAYAFTVSAENNFVGCQGKHYRFALVGSMQSLSSITEIPTTGWAYQVAVEPGHGYVALCEQGSIKFYTRIYVAKWILSPTDNHRIGVQIQYQSPFAGGQ